MASGEQQEFSLGPAKTCAHCHQSKPLTQFYTHSHTKDGHRNKCIPCWKLLNKKSPEYVKKYRAENIERIRAYDRARQSPGWKKKAKSEYDKRRRKLTRLELRNNFLKRTFGITLDHYNSLVSKQNGLCAICGRSVNCKSNTGKVKALNIDHCHKTGKIRGLLCDRCNRGIGLLGDSPEILLRAMAYLRGEK